ncbi:MAG TPA: purine-binding chemotaxis protein CheW [Peptococcaceae bacterium]|nr:purine-binding chemotaxis protein CheW [Peptococcaceae bacterium]
MQTVVFTLGKEEYGIPIEDVREIARLEKIYPVPQVFADVKGLINIRGQAIPLLDLHKRFDVRQVQELQYAIIIEIKSSLVALAVEEVKEVKFFEEVSPPPALLKSPMLGGLINLQERIIILLKPEGLLQEEELKLLQDLIAENT